MTVDHSITSITSEPIRATMSVAPDDALPQKRRLLLLAPLFIFVGFALALAKGLTRDPTRIPSALIGKSVPRFSLPPVKGRTLGLSSADLNGQVSLVNSTLR